MGDFYELLADAGIGVRVLGLDVGRSAPLEALNLLDELRRKLREG